MASLRADADAVKSAVSSVSTCTATTIVTLKSLLLISSDSSTGSTLGPTKSTTAITSKAPRRTKATVDGSKNELPAKERAVLATQVINGALKALTEAAKPSPQLPSKKEDQDDLVKTVTRRELRRSNSLPLSPLQPRTLSRQNTSPIKTVRPRAVSATTNVSASCLPTVECARIAFSALKTLQVSGEVKLAELQLEAGILSLAAKLISLGLHEQAVKELRIFRRRVEETVGHGPKPQPKATAIDNKTMTTILAELLDYSAVKVPESMRYLTITSQVYVLRILAEMKKPQQLEAALPLLRTSHPTSVINRILSLAKSAKHDVSKDARQMETVSHTLLPLGPSISSKDDTIATDPRLSVSPTTAFELQSLGIEARLLWWKLAGHQGQTDADILLPLSRCMGAAIRRAKDRTAVYTVCKSAVARVYELLASLPKQPTPPATTSKSPQSIIFQTLTAMAEECGDLENALHWAEKLRTTLYFSTESPTKTCSVLAQVLTIQLKLNPAQHLCDEGLLNQVVSGVQGSLRGDSAELDELLDKVSGLRKAIIPLLFGHVKDLNLSPSSKTLLEAFVSQCPRFCVRWLGKPPSPTSSTKDYLRYEQRQQLLSRSIRNTLDCALSLIKTRLDENRLGWDELHTLLSECLILLDLVGDNSLNALHHVKISNFYYKMFSSLFHKKGSEATALKALRRSIDCIKDRPAAEKEKGQLLAKLEKMHDSCKSVGRHDDALGALQNLRTCLVDGDVLEGVALALQKQHPQVAWTSDYKTNLLNRTLQAIEKLEMVHMDWTVDFPESQQAAALEQRLHFVLLSGEKQKQELTLGDSTVDALLRIYIPTRFPIRRLRTLLRLLGATVGNPELTSKICSIAADAAQLEEKALGEDIQLAPYLPHLRALFASLSGLIDGYPDHEALKSTLSVWRSMVDSHPTKEGLEACIDGVEALLLHLESVADFLRLKGTHDLVDTVIRLGADLSRVAAGPRPETFVSSHLSLAMHLTDSGLSSQAVQTLEAAEAFVAQSEDAPGHVAAELQLALADQLLVTGELGKSIDHLTKATAAFARSKNTSRAPRSRKKIIFAQASYVQALIALNQGKSDFALSQCRESVKALYQEWVNLEAQLSNDTEKTVVDESKMDTSTSIVETTETRTVPATGPGFWTLFNQLFRALLQLSAIYVHLGMFQETTYHAELAEKMARTINSRFHIAQVATWMASVHVKAGMTGKATELVNEARNTLGTEYRSCSSLALICQIGAVYRDLHDFTAEKQMLDMAETMLAALKPESPNKVEEDTGDLEKKMAKLDIKETTVTRVRATRRTVKAPAASIARKTSTTITKTKLAASATTVPVAPEDPYLSSLRLAIELHKAMSLLSKKDWAGASNMLRDATLVPRHSSGVLRDHKQVILAASLIGQSLESMAHDSVFGDVPDSTLSFPTIAKGGKSDGDRLSLTASPPAPARKGRTPAAARKAEAIQQGFVASLLEAQNALIEAHAEVALTGNASELHRVSSMLQTVTLVLSTISGKGKTLSHIGHVASSTDLARNLTWRRERKAVVQEKHIPKLDVNGWPAAMSSSEDSSRRTSLGFSTDLVKFQRDYVDIIPKTWATLSLSLSDNKHDLIITRLQAGQSPFVIRLPLERASSRDADTEVFNFRQGKAALLEIIEAVNKTCHDTRDMTVKTNKQAWWTDREDLDNQMKELVESIERDWLGGFRGIFSQHTRRADLLARFQKSLQNVLDKHLPSRRQVRGRKTKASAAASTSPKITLDPRILELFIGLGDSTKDDEDCEFFDALTDLLYFVFDILQFHGERNALDEIDMDAMVVDTMDALHAYHAAARADSLPSTNTHTILVVDKALHPFPWESLPCTRGQAISRVPSLACLRRMILDQHQPSPSSEPGHHINPQLGTWILNPGSDLKSTQSTFHKPLSTHLSTWKSVSCRIPTEPEFESALTTPLSTLLYFGHGSGAQYIRGKTIRRMVDDPGCKAVSLLWGCSSARLVENGEFEVYGTVWNYLLGGCPAVTGTLWDVTDRDIDRMAGRTLENWGLLPQGSVRVEEKVQGKAGCTKGKKKEGEGEKEGRKLSLVEAVAKAREEACRFRYLTAAAVVVYGIPVYVGRKE